MAGLGGDLPALPMRAPGRTQRPAVMVGPIGDPLDLRVAGVGCRSCALRSRRHPSCLARGHPRQGPGPHSGAVRFAGLVPRAQGQGRLSERALSGLPDRGRGRRALRGTVHRQGSGPAAGSLPELCPARVRDQQRLGRQPRRLAVLEPRQEVRPERSVAAVPAGTQGLRGQGRQVPQSGFPRTHRGAAPSSRTFFRCSCPIN